MKFILFLTVLLSTLHAQVPRPVSVTFSPIHLGFPVLEVTAEAAINPKFGVAGILGYGSMSLSNGFEEIDLPVFEIGAQANYYALGDFDHGMQLGAELLWVKISFDDDDNVSAEATGLAFGPLIGYKVISSAGFTFLLQAGYQKVIVEAEASDNYGNSDEESKSDGIPLVNINFGWSF
jgi:hypothetical protein